MKAFAQYLKRQSPAPLCRRFAAVGRRRPAGKKHADLPGGAAAGADGGPGFGHVSVSAGGNAG